ncbi:T9SS type A sorting domain-containing protein [Flavihumibacter sp. R14]|nr:T9SS type A sorting domain-containing protein [Flavihumibacter soli]
MKKIYLRIVAFTLVTALCVLVSGVVQARVQVSPADTTKTTRTKITDTRKNKPAYLKNGVKVNFVPFKPQVDKVFGNTSTVPPKISEVDTIEGDDNKILNNVKVYPNPVTDQLNLTYLVSKDSNVTIMIMDVLGNEVTTLYSERVQAGQQNHSFSIASKLTSGFYFVRLIVGTETVIKRISVL